MLEHLKFFLRTAIGWKTHRKIQLPRSITKGYDGWTNLSREAEFHCPIDSFLLVTNKPIGPFQVQRWVFYNIFACLAETRDSSSAVDFLQVQFTDIHYFCPEQSSKTIVTTNNCSLNSWIKPDTIYCDLLGVFRMHPTQNEGMNTATDFD